jgi:hypothetical protein
MTLESIYFIGQTVAVVAILFSFMHMSNAAKPYP